ncbi:MAG: tRNA epoxyqueuosine(34) reductase QueG [Methylohalobius sp.]|nr:tRNA epoxyqueuosine(34) reductase QueG [Methylohalobius sp.]
MNAPLNLVALKQQIQTLGQKLGFDAVGIASIDLTQASEHFKRFLAQGFHGQMNYLAKHGEKRFRPELLLPGTVSILCARLSYLPQPQNEIHNALSDPTRAYIARYALGRDYHKVIKKRLLALARQIEARIGPFGYRVFCDSAPVLEKPLAQQAGLGFYGKHTNLIAFKQGSWFFLGEIYTDLPLPPDLPVRKSYCGHCRACMDICPTGAIIAPYQLDARRCISYLTIEHHGPIPQDLRPKIGNRIFGCDDCQLVCPWNRKAHLTQELDFLPRHGLERANLVKLFSWSEEEFLAKAEGSAIRRLGYERWLRNLAVGLGNAPTSPQIVSALKARLDYPSPLVREHVAWALEQHARRQGDASGRRTRLQVKLPADQLGDIAF